MRNTIAAFALAIASVLAALPADAAQVHNQLVFKAVKLTAVNVSGLSLLEILVNGVQLANGVGTESEARIAAAMRSPAG